MIRPMRACGAEEQGREPSPWGTVVGRARFTGGVAGLAPSEIAPPRQKNTGSGWTLSGRAVDGPLRGQRLQPIPHGNHFWFAWAVFQPETEVWQP